MAFTMNIGVSSACFYPLETEHALIKIGEMGIHTAEIFFNSFSEISPAFLKEINRIRHAYNMDIQSVHPFSSFTEAFFFFSNYKRRFYDTLEYYKKYFEAAQTVGASYLAIHGGKKPLTIEENDYFDRFSLLYEEGQQYGITVAQENVFGHVSQDPCFLERMRNYMGGCFKMVYDIKQTRKANYILDDFLPAFSDSIVHIHVSDHNQKQTCLPPGKGNFDFEKLFSMMNCSGYKGSYIIELYRENYGEYSEILDAYNFLKNKD